MDFTSSYQYQPEASSSYHFPPDSNPSSTGTPAAAETKTRKLKEPRVVRACDSCRKKKIRCLGGSPEKPCAHCVSASTPCTFETRTIRRGPPKGYVESLERRLEAMEKLLTTLSGSTAMADLEAFEGEETAEEWRRDQAGSGSGTPPLRLETVDTLAVELEEMSMDNDRFIGRGSGFHLARSIRQYSKDQSDDPAQVDVDTAPDTSPSLVENLLAQEQRQRSAFFKLPPPDLATKLLNAFWDDLNTFVPILHRPSFERAVSVGLLETDTSFRSLFFVMCAIGARFLDDERLTVPSSPLHPAGSEQSRGFDFFRAASNSASPLLISATLFDLQCSVLTVVWLLGSTSPVSAWAAVGFAIRRAVDVGAHREGRAKWCNSPLQDQLRKRAFHALYGLDRSISASLGRPLAIQDEDFDLLDALDIDDAALDEWELRGAKSPPPPPSAVPGPLSGAQCMRKLQRIMGRALRLLYGTARRGTESPQKITEAVCELDSLLNEWLNHVPLHLRWNPTEQDPRWLPQSVALYSSYYCCQILVHRDFLSPARAKLHSFPSLAICSNAARSCSHVLDHLRKQGQLASAFWYAPLCAITAGLVLLINVFARGHTVASLTSSAMGDVQKCISVLDELGERTFVAQKAGTGLRKLANLATAPTRTRDPTLPSLKRANPDDADSPTSSVPSAGPSPSSTGQDDHREGDSRPTGKHARHSRDDLPLTTQDLGLPTFNGHQTVASSRPSGLPPAPQYAAWDPTASAAGFVWQPTPTTVGDLLAQPQPQLPPIAPPLSFSSFLADPALQFDLATPAGATFDPSFANNLFEPVTPLSSFGQPAQGYSTHDFDIPIDWEQTFGESFGPGFDFQSFMGSGSSGGT